MYFLRKLWDVGDRHSRWPFACVSISTRNPFCFHSRPLSCLTCHEMHTCTLPSFFFSFHLWNGDFTLLFFFLAFCRPPWNANFMFLYSEGLLLSCFSPCFCPSLKRDSFPVGSELHGSHEDPIRILCWQCSTVHYRREWENVLLRESMR